MAGSSRGLPRGDAAAEALVTVPAMTPAEIHAFVQGVCDGRIFTIGQCRTQVDAELVFMPLALGCLTEKPEDFRGSIGMIWEWMREASRASWNGYPVFGSCRFMNKRVGAAGP